MKPKRYIVSRGLADRWEIGFDLVSVGFFSSEAAAVESAIKAACSHEHSAGCEVIVQQADGSLRIVWTYGNDPSPS